jgi:hypothetical protein
MKYILNRIYYSLYKAESFLYQYGKKGRYSGGAMIQMLLYFEIGISTLLASILTLPIVHIFGYNEIIVFMFLLISLLLLLLYVEKWIWQEPSEEELSTYEINGICLCGWFLVGLSMYICSFIFMLTSFLIVASNGVFSSL